MVGRTNAVTGNGNTKEFVTLTTNIIFMPDAIYMTFFYIFIGENGIQIESYKGSDGITTSYRVENNSLLVHFMKSSINGDYLNGYPMLSGGIQRYDDSIAYFVTDNCTIAYSDL